MSTICVFILNFKVQTRNLEDLDATIKIRLFG